MVALRELLTNHLATAKRHVSEGNRIVARQRALVQFLKNSGYPSDMAEQLLSELISLQELFEINCARIQAELDQLNQ